MTKYLIPWKSLLIAPLASMPMIVIGGLGSSDAGIASDFTWGIVFAISVGLPFTYFGIAVVGVPVYLILCKFGLLRSWIFGAIGALVPLVIFATAAPFRTSLMALVAGAAVGVTAYFLLPVQVKSVNSNEIKATAKT